MEDDRGASFPSEIGDEFRTFEDYLDTQIKPLDLYYLQDQEVARQLVELGHKGSSLEREEFETMKAAAVASRLASKSQQKKLANAGKELKDNFLRAMAEREEANRSGEMNSIIFIRDRNSHGHEISGYIDYSHRLKTEDFEPYFSGKKRLLPRPTDLRHHLVTALSEFLSSLTYMYMLSFMTTSSENPEAVPVHHSTIKYVLKST
ncbi:cilia- and flagella-associated protein 299 isoform X2 [Triplophysa dalaica]|uniref:cilia- and flagella-associated protein 299 isoform X2 n=1 Tax=Triplophysa dalaica TaxID=1582913 RepID=UPI0024DFB46E|nr:cilia- and flagella-associated protein 299 isoform X2 [Triplophysa dalaica]